MRLIPHHQDDKYGPREYRSPDGTWRVVRTPRPGGSRNDRPRWEVHERHDGRAGGWCHHAAFERRRDALVFLDTTPAASGSESVTTALRQAARDPRTLAIPAPPSAPRHGATQDRSGTSRNPAVAAPCRMLVNVVPPLNTTST